MSRLGLVAILATLGYIGLVLVLAIVIVSTPSI